MYCCSKSLTCNHVYSSTKDIHWFRIQHVVLTKGDTGAEKLRGKPMVIDLSTEETDFLSDPQSSGNRID